MIKAVFFDIDGTLVTRQARALPSTQRALKELQAQGIICGIATGRGPGNLIQQLDELNLDLFVTYNGQYVYTPDKVLFANAFSADLVARLAAFGNEHQRHLLFGGANGMMGSRLMTFGEKTWAKRLQRYLPRGKFLKRLKPLFKKISQSSHQTDYTTLSILAEPIFQCVLICEQSEQAEIEALFPECQAAFRSDHSSY